METPHGVLEMPDFGLSEEEKAYKGPPEDRRALMHHRKWIQVRACRTSAALLPCPRFLCMAPPASVTTTSHCHRAATVLRQ